MVVYTCIMTERYLAIGLLNDIYEHPMHTDMFSSSSLSLSSSNEDSHKQRSANSDQTVVQDGHG